MEAAVHFHTIVLLLACATSAGESSDEPERLPFHVSEVVHTVRRSFSALSDTHAIVLGQALDVIVFPSKSEVGGTAPSHLLYYHAVERESVPEVLRNDEQDVQPALDGKKWDGARNKWARIQGL